MGRLSQTSAEKAWDFFFGGGEVFLRDKDLWGFWSLGPSVTYPKSRAKPPKFPVADGKPPPSSLALQPPVHAQSSPAARPGPPTCAGVLGIPRTIF